MRSFLVLYVVGFWMTGAALQAAPEETRLKTLARARLDLARKGLEGARTLEDRLVWLQRVLKSELALADTPDRRMAVLQTHLQRLRRLEASAVEGLEKGAYSPVAVLEVQYTRIDFEVYVEEEKAKHKPSSR